MKNPITILAADEDKTTLEIIEESLIGDEFRILTTTSAEEVLEILTTFPDVIHVVILDWMIPEMGGIDTLKWIKNQPKFKSVPVILQIEDESQMDMLTEIRQNVFQYLIKPFTEETLRELIQLAVKECKQTPFSSSKRQAPAKVEKKATTNPLPQSPKVAQHKPFNRLQQRQREERLLKLNLQSQQIMNEFFMRSLSCKDHQELSTALLAAAKQFKFESSHKKYLRCSIRLAGETEIEISDRGVKSQIDVLILSQSLETGKVIQGGSYTAIPSKRRHTAIMIRNTPTDIEEAQTAIEILSMLLNQFEERLVHFENELHVLKKNEQIQNIVFSCNKALGEVNQAYQQMKEQQMQLLENLASTTAAEISDLTTEQTDKLISILNTRMMQAMELYTVDQITDQKFLMTLEELKNLFNEQKSQKQKNLEPGQLSGKQQEDVDQLLALLGI